MFDNYSRDVGFPAVTDDSVIIRQRSILIGVAGLRHRHLESHVVESQIHQLVQNIPGQLLCLLGSFRMVRMIAVYPGNHGHYAVGAGDCFACGIDVLTDQNIRPLFHREIHPRGDRRILILCGFGKVYFDVAVVFLQRLLGILGNLEIDHGLVQDKITPVPVSS